MSAYAEVRQAYAEASVMTAPPERLVVMLYDGAIRFLTQAAVALSRGELEAARTRLRRGEAIIDELNLSLDMEQGEVATRLRALYFFCKRHLIDAGVHRDPKPVDEVVSLLGELRDAWEQVAAERARGA